MSWLLADVKKRVVDAKSTIEQSFKDDSIKEKNEENSKDERPKTCENESIEVEENSTDNTKTSMSAIFGGIKVGSGLASTKLFEYAKDAGKKLEVVKNAVIENTMFGDLNKEQIKFGKKLDEEKEKVKIEGLPWVGLPDEELAKKQILSLSMDTRNFLRDSPANSEYSQDEQQALALLLLKEDPNLANVRFQLVPKQVKENTFWQNYFYRVSLIRQSIIGQVNENMPKECEIENEKESNQNENEKEKTAEQKEDKSSLSEDVTQSEDELENLTTSEQPTTGEQTATTIDDDWEKEILADLNEYGDLVEKTGKDDEAWEAEIQEMLNSE